MKVLFITSTRIGDAVLSTSVLNYIKQKFPHSSLYIATGKNASLLFKNFNNVNKLKNNRVIYSTLLSPQGKLLHDFFLFKNKEKIYLDAPKYNIKKLKEKLDLYKLNRNVEICEKKIHSYYLFYGKLSNKIFLELKKEINLKIFNDPRNINLGSRIICYEKKDEDKLIKIIKNKEIKLNSQEYEKQRF